MSVDSMVNGAAVSSVLDVRSSAVSAGFPVDGSYVSVSPADGRVVVGLLVMDDAVRASAGVGDRVLAAVVLDRDVAVGEGPRLWFGEVSSVEVCVRATASSRFGVHQASSGTGWWLEVREATVEALRAQGRARSLVRESATQEREAVTRVRLEHQRWLDGLVDAAHVWADDNSLCSRFDDFMAEQGLPERQRDYTVYIDVQLGCRVGVNVSARDEDSAMENVDDDDVRSEVAGLLGTSALSELDMTDWDVSSAERD